MRDGLTKESFQVHPVFEPEICRFHAVNAGQTANGLRFGVVSDRSCLLDKIVKPVLDKDKIGDKAVLRIHGYDKKCIVGRQNFEKRYCTI